MHPSSTDEMKKFIEGYLDKTKELKIVEIGCRDPNRGRDLNATYRELFNNPGWTFHGLDLASGNGVDIVSKDPYRYPVADGEYDVVISGQTAEHVEDLFTWIVECARILKPGGYICIIAPWSWEYHPHPVDCWRILRDGMRYLLSYKAGLTVVDVHEREMDCVGIAQKPIGGNANNSTDDLEKFRKEVVKGEDLNINVTERMSNKVKF